MIAHSHRSKPLLKEKAQQQQQPHLLVLEMRLKTNSIRMKHFEVKDEKSRQRSKYLDLIGIERYCFELC